MKIFVDDLQMKTAHNENTTRQYQPIENMAMLKRRAKISLSY